MASFKSIRCGDQEDRYRQFDQIIGQSAALEAVPEGWNWSRLPLSTVLIQGRDRHREGTGGESGSTISVRATTVPS